jgi:hypothetical protein
MSLTYGMKWTFYLLMAQHPTTANNDGKSQFRTDVEADAGAAADLRPSLIKIANARFSLAIAMGDLPQALPPSPTAVQLRHTLGFTNNDYDPSMGPCPDGGFSTVTPGMRVDHQNIIATALLGLRQP